MSTPEICADSELSGGRVSAVGRIVRYAQARLAAHREERARWQTVRILRALDERTLKDIGIERSEIESLVYRGRSGRGRLR
jgi:uncharacterized protein YjiS (DUF1127 family)